MEATWILYDLGIVTCSCLVDGHRSQVSRFPRFCFKPPRNNPCVFPADVCGCVLCVCAICFLFFESLGVEKNPAFMSFYFLPLLPSLPFYLFTFLPFYLFTFLPFYLCYLCYLCYLFTFLPFYTMIGLNYTVFKIVFRVIFCANECCLISTIFKNACDSFF
jgi:hypothetical protein